MFVEKKPKDDIKHPRDWYCYLCDTTDMLNMRKCSNCNVWVHDDCLGLTELDEEEFVCIKCE